MKRFERQMNLCLSKILQRRKTNDAKAVDSIEVGQRKSSRQRVSSVDTAKPMPTKLSGSEMTQAINLKITNT